MKLHSDGEVPRSGYLFRRMHMTYSYAAPPLEAASLSRFTESPFSFPAVSAVPEQRALPANLPSGTADVARFWEPIEDWLID